MDTLSHLDQFPQNPSPISPEPVSHAIATGIGAVAGGAIAGAAIGTVVGPIGTAIGVAIGAIAGGLATKAVAESVDLPIEDDVLPEDYDSLIEPSHTDAVVLDHEVIAKHAYGIWEEKGRSDGHALEDWLQAESSLLA